MKIQKAPDVKMGRPLRYPELHKLEVGECGIFNGITDKLYYRAKNFAADLRRRYGWTMSVYKDHELKIIRIIRRA